MTALRIVDALDHKSGIITQRFACTEDGCQKTFAIQKLLNTKKSIREHVASFHDGERFPCKYCDTTLANRGAARKHEKACAKGPNPVSPKTIPCDYPGCSSLSASPHDARKHAEIHAADRPRSHPCLVCARMFFDPTSARPNQHKCLNAPGPEEFERCEVCDKDYRKDKMVRHRLTHTGEKQHWCQIQGCHYRSGERSKVKVHEECAHKDGKDLFCPGDCGFKGAKWEKSRLNHSASVNLGIENFNWGSTTEPLASKSC